VDDHDVTRAYALAQRRPVVGQHLLVDRASGVVERATVAGGAVQSVVDALSDGEELRRALDHDPADVDPGPAGVGDQRLEQLRDTAAASRRVDVPDNPAGEQLARPAHALLERLEVRGLQYGLEPRGAHRRDLDLEHVCLLH
jgi:hypothetical protein